MYLFHLYDRRHRHSNLCSQYTIVPALWANLMGTSTTYATACKKEQTETKWFEKDPTFILHNLDLLLLQKKKYVSSSLSLSFFFGVSSMIKFNRKV